jgi:hypothetical protein
MCRRIFFKEKMFTCMIFREGLEAVIAYKKNRSQINENGFFYKL